MRMGMQYQQKPLLGQAMALAAGHSSSAGFYAGAEGIAASNISTVLLLLQLAL